MSLFFFQILSVISFILSTILFIRVILLDKDYGEISIVRIYDGNIKHTSFDKDGYYIQRIKFDISPIKGDIFNVSFNGIESSEISIGCLTKGELLKSNILCIDILCDNPKLIKISFEDKFNNKYRQSIKVCPPKIKNGKSYPFSVSINNRKWIMYIFNNLILKYFR